MAKSQSGRSSYLDGVGANDPDRKTPAHDWILLEWLTKERLQSLADEWYPSPAWSVAQLERAARDAVDNVEGQIAALERDAKQNTFAMNRLIEAGKKSSAEELLALKNRTEATESSIEQLRLFGGLGNPPAVPKPSIYGVRDAHPIYDDNQRSRRPAIYIDRRLQISTPKQIYCEGSRVDFDYKYNKQWHVFPRWAVESVVVEVAFEIKSRIPSYSEIIQQLQTYRGYLGRTKIVVVCPDDQFKDAIEMQGFTFLTCPKPPESKVPQPSLF